MGFKSGTHWYNNGEIEGVYFEGSEPEGFVKGRLPVQQETKDKISSSWLNRSQEEKDQINKQRSQSWIKTYNLMSEEEKALLVETRTTTMKNKSDKEKQEYRDKISASTLGKNKGKTPYNKGLTKETNESVMHTAEKVSAYMKEFNSKQSPEYFKRWRAKMRATMHANGNDSPNKMSSAEKKVYKELCEKYGDSHVHYHNDGKLDARYPYEVDFYVDTEDLFIEVQGHPSHGDHAFDEKCEDDLELLKSLKDQGTNWSNMILSVWAGSDIEKRTCAKNNNLNFLEIY